MPPQHKIVREARTRRVRAALVELSLWAAMALLTALAVRVLDVDAAPDGQTHARHASAPDLPGAHIGGPLGARS